MLCTCQCHVCCICNCIYLVKSYIYVPFPIFHGFILFFIYSFINFFIHSFINKHVLTTGTGLNPKYSITALSTFTLRPRTEGFHGTSQTSLIDNKYFLRARLCIFAGKYECLYWSYTCYSTFCHSWFWGICHILYWHSYWRFSWREPDFILFDNTYFLRARLCIFAATLKPRTSKQHLSLIVRVDCDITITYLFKSVLYSNIIINGVEVKRNV
jgi:hypothetical protein